MVQKSWKWLKYQTNSRKSRWTPSLTGSWKKVSKRDHLNTCSIARNLTTKTKSSRSSNTGSGTTKHARHRAQASTWHSRSTCPTWRYPRFETSSRRNAGNTSTQCPSRPRRSTSICRSTACPRVQCWSAEPSRTTTHATMTTRCMTWVSLPTKIWNRTPSKVATTVASSARVKMTSTTKCGTYPTTHSCVLNTRLSLNT